MRKEICKLRHRCINCWASDEACLRTWWLFCCADRFGCTWSYPATLPLPRPFASYRTRGCGFCATLRDAGGRIACGPSWCGCCNERAEWLEAKYGTSPTGQAPAAIKKGVPQLTPAQPPPAPKPRPGLAPWPRHCWHGPRNRCSRNSLRLPRAARQARRAR